MTRRTAIGIGILLLAVAALAWFIAENTEIREGGGVLAPGAAAPAVRLP